MDVIGNVNVVQVFMEKVNELANTCGLLLSKEQIMASIEPSLLQKLQQLSS